ncbi:hypothetical protein D3C86_1658750 [compost metagenome]
MVLIKIKRKIVSSLDLNTTDIIERNWLAILILLIVDINLMNDFVNFNFRCSTKILKEIDLIRIQSLIIKPANICFHISFH